MSSLTGNLISSTYPSLLKTSGNIALSGSLVRITDGLGNLSPLALSTGSVAVYGSSSFSGSVTIDYQDADQNSLYIAGGIIAGIEGYLNPSDGGYTRIVHNDTVNGGMTVVRPTTVDNVNRNFATNTFYISTVAPAGSGSIYIQPGTQDKLVIRGSNTVSGSRNVPVQVTGSINTTGTVTSTGLDLTGSIALQGTGSITLAGTLAFNAGEGNFVLPSQTPPIPVVGSAYFSGNTLYIYDGTNWLSTTLS